VPFDVLEFGVCELIKKRVIGLGMAACIVRNLRSWLKIEIKIKVKVKVKIFGFECQTSGKYSKRVKKEQKKDNAAACLCFLNYLAFLRPAADRAVSILPWVVSRGRSYGFLWANLNIQRM
jgi:hypothetical protein